MYDLVVKGGTVVDPSQGLHAPRDVALEMGKVVAVEEDIDPTHAREVVKADGLLVTPGLVDIHVHVYWGVSHYGVEPDLGCLAKGVTTAVDAGSAGADTFPGLRRYVIKVASTRLYAFLNISSMGMITDVVGELNDLRFADPALAVRVARAKEDVIVGIKVRLDRDRVGDNGPIKPLRLARQAADKLNLPIMIHIGRMDAPLAEILSYLREGDLVTHTYHGHEGGILDDRGKLIGEARQARERGVLFDVGHGAGSFAFRVAQRALDQGFTPGTISSDLHVYNINGPVFDLATTMSKFMHLGLSLDEVVDLCTWSPARAVGIPESIGTLKPSAEGDVALFRLEEGEFEFVDCEGETVLGERRLVAVNVIRGGEIYSRG